MDPSYLDTISMTELLDNVYQGKEPLIKGLLYLGTYLFVGAPKIGKSFLIAQIATMSARESPSGDSLCGRGWCCIWRWRMIITDFRNACTACSGRKRTGICTFPSQPVN